MATLQEFGLGGVWDLVEGYQERQVYTYSDEVQYPQIDVTLVLERQSNLDKKIAVLPLLCAASLLLATFWTHPVSGARLKLNSACMTLLIINLLALRLRLPSAGGNLPLVIAFNTGLVVLAVFQLILALSLSNLVRRLDNPPISVIPYLKIISPYLFLSNVPLIGQVPSHMIQPWSESGDAERPEPTLGSKEEKQLTGWNLFAQAVDRIAFFIYLFTVLIFIATCIGGSTSKLV